MKNAFKKATCTKWDVYEHQQNLALKSLKKNKMALKPLKTTKRKNKLG